MKIAMTVTSNTDVKTGAPTPSGVSESILSPAMRDFWSGMLFLHRYATRCHADIRAIGKNNLRLLHNTLMADAHYREILSEAAQCDARHGHPIARKLFATMEIYAEIVSVRQGNTLPLPPQPDQLCLQMVLSGHAKAAGASRKPQSLTRRMQGWLRGGNARSSHSIKAHDVIWDIPSNPRPQVLTAASNVCVVLCVHLPLSSLTKSRDTLRHRPASRMAMVG